jgi:hypothetical protein
MRHLVLIVSTAVACGDPPTFSPDPVDATTPIDAPDDDGLVTVTITKSGVATGTVATPDAAVSCGATCELRLPPGTFVTLVTEPDPGASFVGWGGPCSGAISTCAFTLGDDDVEVSAEFAVAMHEVQVELAGNGTGHVRSGAGELDCPGLCTATLPYGSALTLTATSTGMSSFLGFGGGTCSGTTACTFTVGSDVEVDASFGLNYTLVVTRAGNGTGTVTGSGINCGTDCDQVYSAGAMVTLTATAAASSTFTGWSGGGCSGTGSCAVTINAAVTVQATFVLRTYNLGVEVAGTGGGVIASNPAGISCPGDCMQVYNHGQNVTLNATSNGASLFSGWSGACTGTGACTVAMTQARNVTATFEALLVAEPQVAGSGTARYVLGTTTNRACFLARVAGNFDSGAGDVNVTIDGGEWVMTVTGPVDGWAQCLTWPGASEIFADQGTTWTQGEPFKAMGSVTRRFCGLTRMAGRFAGGGEQILVYPYADQWILTGGSAQVGVTAGARCVTWPVTTVLSYTADVPWSQGNPVVDLGPVGNRYCTFSMITGRYHGLGEATYLLQGASWLLGGASDQADVASRARCLTAP